MRSDEEQWSPEAKSNALFTQPSAADLHSKLKMHTAHFAESFCSNRHAGSADPGITESVTLQWHTLDLKKKMGAVVLNHTCACVSHSSDCTATHSTLLWHVKTFTKTGYCSLLCRTVQFWTTFCYFVHLKQLGKLVKLLTSSLVTMRGGIAMSKAKLGYAVKELPAHLQHVCDQLHLGSGHRVCVYGL